MRTIQTSPTRTVFVRGLSPATTINDLQAHFGPFGDLRKCYTAFIETKGIAFLSYYDIRHSEAALALNGKELLGRKLEVAYSTPKEKDDDRPDADTLFVIKKGNSDPINTEELSRVFSQWGEVKRIGDNARSLVQKFVQYHDTRALPKALAGGNGLAFEGGTLEVEEAKSNFSGKPPRDRSGASSSSRRRSRSSSRDRHRKSSSRRHRSRSRSRSKDSSRKRRSRSRSSSRSRSRSRSRDKKRSSGSSSSGLQTVSSDWAREAAQSIYAGAPQPGLQNFVTAFQPAMAPMQQAQPGVDPQQMLNMVQQNPQLLNMLMTMTQLTQQQPMQQMAPQQMQQQRFQQFQPQQQGQPVFQAAYPAVMPQQAQLGGSRGSSTAPTGSLASLAASLEKLRKK